MLKLEPVTGLYQVVHTESKIKYYTKNIVEVCSAECNETFVVVGITFHWAFVLCRHGFLLINNGWFFKGGIDKIENTSC